MADVTIVSQGENFVRYSDDTILIRGVRCSYPHLDKPQKGKDNSRETYSIQALLPKSTHKAAMEACKKRIEELQTANKKEVAKDKWFITNGDSKAKEETKGMYCISAREVDPPFLRDKNGRPVPQDQAKRMFYGGCWVDIIIRPWFQKNEFGTRVNAGLTAVKFVRDDEAFGEGRISDEDVSARFGVGDDDTGGFDDDDLDDL